jgi:hypothetical protein
MRGQILNPLEVGSVAQTWEIDKFRLLASYNNLRIRHDLNLLSFELIKALQM